MKLKMTLFIADKRMNQMMQAVGLRPPGKWYVTQQVIEFEKPESLDTYFFRDIILKSRESDWGYWIPAIRFNVNTIFVDDGVEVLVDERKEINLKDANEKK